MSRPRFTRRDRAAVVDGKREFFGPEDEADDGEGDRPDVCPVCSLVGTHKLQCPQRGLWPQELAEQQEEQP